MVFDFEQEFMDYIEHLVKEAMGKADIELTKARECKDLLELPKRKENWDALEKASDETDEHIKRALSHIRETMILTKGLEVFRDGLIYKEMKNSRFIKKKEDKIE